MCHAVSFVDVMKLVFKKIWHLWDSNPGLLGNQTTIQPLEQLFFFCYTLQNIIDIDRKILCIRGKHHWYWPFIHGMQHFFPKISRSLQLNINTSIIHSPINMVRFQFQNHFTKITNDFKIKIFYTYISNAHSLQSISMAEEWPHNWFN